GGQPGSHRRSAGGRGSAPDGRTPRGRARDRRPSSRLDLGGDRRCPRSVPPGGAQEIPEGDVMFERFAPDVRRAVLEAAEEAAQRRDDPRLGTEHLLLGAVTIEDPVTEAFGLTAEVLRARLAEWDAGALQAVGIDGDVEV